MELPTFTAAKRRTRLLTQALYLVSFFPLGVSLIRFLSRHSILHSSRHVGWSAGRRTEKRTSCSGTISPTVSSAISNNAAFNLPGACYECSRTPRPERLLLVRMRKKAKGNAETEGLFTY